MNTRQQENLVFRYLLGDLSEAEQTALELKYFADDERFEEVWAAENELIDAYVRNRMSRRERELFERNYLKSPGHRERVAFARTLLKVADDTQGENIVRAASEPAVSWWQRLLESLRGPQLLLAGAMAVALVVLALGTVWLINDRMRLNSELARSQAEEQRARELQRQIQELEQQLAGQRRNSEHLNAELSRLREELQKAETPKASPTAERPALLSVLLTPALVRSGGETQQITITHGTAQVQLRMKPDSSDYARFQVSLKSVEGAEILTRQAVRPATTRTGPVVAVSLPARLLPAGDYILTLSGLTTTGESEEVNRYFFRVTHR